MANPHRVTTLDIAHVLGIGQSTVSMALRDHPRISKALRLKVRETADKLGYRPDPMLSALAQYRCSKHGKPITAELAWINRWPDPARLRSLAEFDAYWRGAREVAESNGYRLEEFYVNPDESLTQLDRILRARNILGILIPPHPAILPWDGLDWSRYVVVRFGYSVANLPVHSIVPDQLGAGMLGFRKPFEKGYRRIGFVIGSGQVLGSRFAAGFLFAQSEVEGSVRVPILHLDEKDPAHDRKLLKDWLKKNKVDGIFTTTRRSCEMLKALGYRVPDDIGVAVSSILDADADAGIDQNSIQIGRLSVETLISLISHNHRGIPETWNMHSTQVKWVDGKSLPDRK